MAMIVKVSEHGLAAIGPEPRFTPGPPTKSFPIKSP